MVREKYGVRLTPEQRNQLQRLVRAGKGAARVTIRARILLKTDAGWSAPQVAEALDVAEGTVYRTKRRFAEAGLGVLQDRPQAHRCRKLDDRGEAHRIAWPAPTRRKGMNTGPCVFWRARWWSWGGALPIPRDGAAAPEKNALKPWQKQEWCIPQVSAEFVAHMEDVLDLYAEPYDPQRPVVCFDETSTQLLAEVREPLPAQPGRPKREDCEYRREGARNLFLACEPLAGWWQVAVTPRRTMRNFAHQMRWLVDQAYPEVPVVRVVLDNPVWWYGAGSEHPPHGVAVRDFPGRRGPAYCETTGVSLHPQARQLAQYGGDRVQCPVPLLPQAAPPQRTGPAAGGPGPGQRAKRGPSHHQLAVQLPGRQGQTSPPLSLQFQT